MLTRRLRIVLAAVLSVALFTAPFAVASFASGSAAAAQAHAHHPGSAGPHDSATDTAKNDRAGGCEQHKSCLGQCCAACAHCAAAGLGVPTVTYTTTPDLHPDVPRLNGRLASAPPGRPPRA